MYVLFVIVSPCAPFPVYPKHLVLPLSDQWPPRESPYVCTAPCLIFDCLDSALLCNFGGILYPTLGSCVHVRFIQEVSSAKSKSYKQNVKTTTLKSI